MRLHVSAGRGLCLSIAPSGVDFRVSLLGRDLSPGTTMSLPGVPSRARVSPDGRYGAVTTFVTGDSYTTTGAFSTRTVVIDMASGKPITDLERFTVVKDGQRLDAPDHNFWGVTFAQDSNRFYATLGTGDHHYLVAGRCVTAPSRCCATGSSARRCPPTAARSLQSAGGRPRHVAAQRARPGDPA
jgi:hypothetical protein